MDKIKILVVCSNVLYRRGLVQMLRDTSYIEVVGDTENSEKAAILVEEFQPDMVLMGRIIGKPTSIELTQRIKKTNPSIIILACTSSIDVKDILLLLQAGADGCLLENTEPETLMAAISAARLGESVIDPQILRVLVRQLTEISEKFQSSPNAQLSDKELQVIRLGAHGMKSKEISGKLNMSVSTVKTHWANIYTKMGVSCRAQAVFCAIKDGYLSLSDIN